jgi:hypothetical protein
MRGLSDKPTVPAAPALVAMVACLGLAAPAAADTFKPTRFDDPAPGKCKPSDCSLREAFRTANRREGHDAIRLDRGRYRMELPPDEGSGEDGGWWAYDVSIRGKGPEETTLDGNAVDSVMQLGNFTESNRLQGVKVTGGNSSEMGAVGGIYATGTDVTVKDVVFADNHTTAGSGGGAVLAPREKLKLIDSKVVKNSANRGGGLFVQPGSAGITKATIRDSTIRGNSSSFGGGVYSSVLELTVQRTTIANNESNEGGGLVLASYFNNLSNPPPSTAIRSSTISGNTAIKGGGILADGNQPGAGGLKQVVTVQNSTVAGNMATADGGGIMADNGATMTLDNATVAHNQANSDNVDVGLAGGVYQHSGASFTLEDSVIAANTLGQGGNGEQCAGAFTGSGGLVIQFQLGTACAVSGSIAEPNDALIGPLADNGGPTETVKLLSGSDAIAIAATCPKKDQRGKPRPEEDCDAGSFERRGL